MHLAPSDLPKAGSSLDFPIAVAIAATRLELPTASLTRTLFLGELGLHRKLHAIRGVLALLSAADD